LLLSDKANLLIRTVITEPFQAISSDITELNYQNGKFYLCVHKDVFGQTVYAYEISQTMKTGLAQNSLNLAIKKVRQLLKIKNMKDKKIIFHQDQGSQYTSYAYVNSVLNAGRISFSAPGTPTDNPGQESFFGRFKDECRDEIYMTETYEEAKKLVIKKLKYYNNKRLHSSINYQSPFSFTYAFLKSCQSGSVN